MPLACQCERTAALASSPERYLETRRTGDFPVRALQRPRVSNDESILTPMPPFWKHNRSSKSGTFFPEQQHPGACLYPEALRRPRCSSATESPAPDIPVIVKRSQQADTDT